ncbi:MAG TPA: hypothetical protein VLI45_07335 [Acidobacteriaceae bacterium]|nr:hypothetical protein [Acidobacteriaceae bacterium]
MAPIRLTLALALLALAAPLLAQSNPAQGFGPLDPSQPTGITVDQIIQKMGEREAAFEQARNQYEFRQTVTIDTISDDTGRPDGEYKQVTDITFDPQGHRAEHVVFAPQNTLERVILTENDLRDIAERIPFILTTAQLPDYNLTYLGKQHVDELDTYVFDCAPKQLVKGHRYFQGKVWVDQQDKEIVLVNGLNVPQDTRRGHEDLSPPFTTYYAQIDGNYWFPVYTKAEGILHFAAQNGALSQDDHMRAIVKFTNYKKFNFHSTVTIHYGDEVLAPGTGQKPTDQKPQPKQ